MIKKIAKNVLLGMLCAAMVGNSGIMTLNVQAAENDRTDAEIVMDENWELTSETVLENGIICKKYTEINDGISPYTSSVEKQKIEYYTAEDGLIIYNIVQTTNWAYGGAAGSVLYLANATDEPRVYNGAGIISQTSNTISNRLEGTTTYTFTAVVSYHGDIHVFTTSTTCNNQGICS